MSTRISAKAWTLRLVPLMDARLRVVKRDQSTESFSYHGCPVPSQQGNTGDQKVHEKNAAGRHLLLLLQYVNHLKGNSSPRGSQSNSPLIDTKLLMKTPLTLTVQDPGGESSFSASPVEEEWEVSWCTLLRRVKRVSWLETKLQVFENITSVLSKEMANSHQKILAFRGQRGLDQDMIRGLELKVSLQKASEEV